MKKLLFAVIGSLIGIIVLLVAAVVVGPSLIDLRPRIATAVRDATGRELRIDGDLRVALLPKLRVSAGGVHLSNAPGAEAPDMLSVDSIALEMEVWPLLGRRVIVNSLVVKRPLVNLEVDKTGRRNWEFTPKAGAAPALPQESREATSGPSVAGMRLGELKVDQGQLSYHNAVTGQTIDAKDAALTGAMAELDSPLALNGRVVLNDEPVTVDVAVDALGKLQHGQRADVKAALKATHISIKFDGAAQQSPVPGLDGVFDLDIPSVGKLASWLNAPLDQAQPDPGPLQVHAVFVADGTKSLLKEAIVVGDALDVKASGGIEASGDATRVTAAVETGVLDIDRYLQPQLHDGTPPPTVQAAARPPAAGEPSAGLSDQPFDLAAFRRLDADVRVTIAGIKARGYEIGRLAFTATAKAGILAAELTELALYGGNVQGTTKLDAAGDGLGVDTSFKIDRIVVDKLAQQFTAEPPSGVVSASLDATARGRSPRALAEDMRGRLTVDFAGAGAGHAAARSVSELKLDVDLPGGEQAPSLKAGVTYNRERIDASASLAPLGKLASGEPFPAKLSVDSKFATLRYDGTVQQRPLPGLDGTFDIDVPSVGKLAAWTGQPLAASQPDPGPFKLHAALATDGPKLALKEAVVTGKAIRATAQGTFDSGRKPAAFDAKVDIEQADLDAYLPPKTATASPGPAPRPSQQPPAGWSREPFDLTALGQADGTAEITLAAVRYRGLDIPKGNVKLTLDQRVLKITVEQLGLAQGTINSATTLDGSGRGAKLDQHVAIAGLQARPLLQAFAGTDRLSGTITFETTVKGSGRSQDELISSLNGAGRLKVTDGAIHGIDLGSVLRQAGQLGRGAEHDKTDFAELSGSYTIKSGIVDNRDMKMMAPLLHLSGSGTVPLPQQTVDYDLEAKLVPSAQGQGGGDALVGIPIPIKVSGPWSNISYQPDWSSVLKGLDPERLKNLPGNVAKTVEGFGASLPGIGDVGNSLIGGKSNKRSGGPSGSAPADKKAAPAGAEKRPLDLRKKLFGD
jgi:AsmA protein